VTLSDMVRSGLHKEGSGPREREKRTAPALADGAGVFWKVRSAIPGNARASFLGRARRRTAVTHLVTDRNIAPPKRGTGRRRRRRGGACASGEGHSGLEAARRCSRGGGV